MSKFRRIYELSKKFPRLTKSFISFILWDLGLEVIELVIDGLRARAAVKLFPVALFDDETETLLFTDWVEEFPHRRRLSPEVMTQQYIAFREKVEPGSKEHAKLVEYSGSFLRMLV